MAIKGQSDLIDCMSDEEKQMLSQENVNMADFWERSHESQNYFISQYGPEVLSDLNVKKLIRPNLKVLEIGVGSGHLTRYLNQSKCIVDAHDIAKNALENVSKYCRKVYSLQEIDSIPNDHYDLVISHLVAQHMNDHDLSHQINWVLQKLNQSGIFALQFLNFLDQPVRTSGLASDKSTQKAGHTSRSLSELLSLCETNGGYMTYANRYIVHKEFSSSWYGVHLVRLDFNGDPVEPSLPHWKKWIKKTLLGRS